MAVGALILTTGKWNPGHTLKKPPIGGASPGATMCLHVVGTHRSKIVENGFASLGLCRKRTGPQSGIGGRSSYLIWQSSILHTLPPVGAGRGK